MKSFLNTIRIGRGAVLGLAIALGACHSIETRIEIDAPPERVWREFAAYRNYGDWNPFIRRFDGTVAVGETIEVEIQPPESDAMVFRPEVLEFDAGKRLEWRGRFLLPGIFTGQHRFELVALEGGRTLFKQSEKFNGILVPLFSFDATRRGFENMNRALKARVESRASGGSRTAAARAER